MSEYVKREGRKARRARRCIWCDELVIAGEEYAAVTWRDGRDIGTEAFHLECEKAWEETGAEEWCSGSFKRGTAEER